MDIKVFDMTATFTAGGPIHFNYMLYNFLENLQFKWEKLSFNCQQQEHMPLILLYIRQTTFDRIRNIENIGNIKHPSFKVIRRTLTFEKSWRAQNVLIFPAILI
jgi:hypothetical protein